MGYNQKEKGGDWGGGGGAGLSGWNGLRMVLVEEDSLSSTLEMLQVSTSTVDCWHLETWSVLSVKMCKSVATFHTEIPNSPAFCKVCINTIGQFTYASFVCQPLSVIAVTFTLQADTVDV